MLTFPKRQIIFSQGDTADAVFDIQEGQVKLSVVSPQGKEAVVTILERGGLFWGRVPRRAAGVHGHCDLPGKLQYCAH